MQLETMQYFDETMDGAPDPAKSSIIDILKWALISEKPLEYSGYKKETNEIIFNNGHGTSNRAFYTFSDGEQSIKSFIEVINSTTIKVLSDISGLRDGFSMSVDSEPYIYKKEGTSHFFTQESDNTGIIVRESGDHAFHIDTSLTSFAGDIFLGAKSNYRILVSRDALVVILFSGSHAIGIAVVSDNVKKNKACGIVSNGYSGNIYWQRNLDLLTRTADRKGGDSVYLIAPKYDLVPHLYNNELETLESYELLPMLHDSSISIVPRVLWAQHVTKVDAVEQLLFAGDARIFSWRTGKKRLIINAGGRHGFSLS